MSTDKTDPLPVDDNQSDADDCPCSENSTAVPVVVVVKGNWRTVPNYSDQRNDFDWRGDSSTVEHWLEATNLALDRSESNERMENEEHCEAEMRVNG